MVVVRDNSNKDTASVGAASMRKVVKGGGTHCGTEELL